LLKISVFYSQHQVVWLQPKVFPLEHTVISQNARGMIYDLLFFRQTRSKLLSTLLIPKKGLFGIIGKTVTNHVTEKPSKGNVTTMPKRLFPPDVIEQAQVIMGGWNQLATPTPTFGSLSSVSFAAEVSTAATLDGQIAVLEAQLTDKRNQRDVVYGSIWDKVKRVRSAVKGIYGDDSSQYEIVGGTRLSERKTRTRRIVSE
jgi:hypothetical protein